LNFEITNTQQCVSSIRVSDLLAVSNLKVGHNYCSIINVNELTKIKALFTPSQPTVKNSGEDVAYHEISPKVKLINHIYCY
jgi:hypothetical protein